MILAYIDPGSGSLMIQAVIAAAIAVPLFFRTQIGRLVAALRHRDGDDQSSASMRDGAGRD